MNFLIYHSGFVSSKPEGAYDPQRTDGIDALITSLHGQRRQAQQQRVCRARFHLALPLDARSGLRRACDGQTVQVHRRRQRALGHGLDLVRLAAGPDPGLPHVPDLGSAARQARLPEDHAAVARQGVRAQRHQALPARGRRARQIHGAATRSRSRAPNMPSGRILRFATYGPRTRREFLNLRAWHAGEP